MLPEEAGAEGSSAAVVEVLVELLSPTTATSGVPAPMMAAGAEGSSAAVAVL